MRRAGRWLGAIFGGLLIAMAALAWLARPAAPDAFYAMPEGPEAADPSDPPGLLLRHEAFERGLPPGTRAWRLLYLTTRDDDGWPVLASALVVAAETAPPGPRPVVAWAHGTTGIAPGCAPSLRARPLRGLPALVPLLERGWVLVAPDYTGLGTEGPHPYLVGEAEARSVLDAVRAARGLEALKLAEATVVWGHSQGGHAALWAGALAPRYAPDVPLAGIAALAPAIPVGPLVEAVRGRPIGRILSSYVLGAYAAAYPDVQPEAYAPGWRGDLAEHLAAYCLDDLGGLYAGALARLAGGPVLRRSALEGPLGGWLAQNTPDAPEQPLLFVQGADDELVRPDLQLDWIDAACTAEAPLELQRLPGRDHSSLVADDSPLVGMLLQWSEARFKGEPVAPGCTGAAAR